MRLLVKKYSSRIYLLLFLVLIPVLVSTYSYAETIILTTHIGNFQCEDGLDNDGDVLIDYPNDPGCSSLEDDNETDVVPGGGGSSYALNPPVIADVYPINNSSGVSATTSLTINWDKIVTIQNGNIIIRRELDDSIFLVIPITSPEVVFSLGQRLTVSSNIPLEEGVGYYVSIDAGVVKDTDGHLNAVFSGKNVWSFTTRDVTPPKIENVAVSPDTHSAVLSWNTDESAVSLFLFGTTTSYTSGSSLDPGYSLAHVLILPNLKENTTYYFSITAKDTTGNNGVPFTGFFTTKDSKNSKPTKTIVDKIKDIFLPGSCPAKGDLNGDCRVDLVDFSILAYWYKIPLSDQFLETEKEKLSGDGKVNLEDFSIMAYYWTEGISQ